MTGSIAVVGSDGQLGTAFTRLLGDSARRLNRASLDLADIDSIGPVLDEIRPDAVVNCAAYTNVDGAEADEETATRVNGEAVAVLAEWAHERSCPLLTFSTDYVFGGDASRPYVESSPPGPLGAYGRSKLVGETAAVASGALVVRTSWVISGSHHNFVATILRAARERPLRVVDDQHGCPTVAADLAAVAYEALGQGVSGLLHLTNQGATTWYGLARAAIEEAGITDFSIEPCATDEFPRPAPRPGYSVLGSERLDGLGIEGLPPWRESLPALVAELMTWI